MTNDERTPAAPRAPARLRLTLGVAGLTALIAAGFGAYVSLAPEQRPAGAELPADRFPLRLHPAPRTVPDIAFVDGTGRKLTLADFRGKVVLLNIWATWCPPCRREMPAGP